jgi:shikimate dehydrogenase
LSGIRLGLIGGNIALSKAPDLHRAAGRLCGIDVTYDLLVPHGVGSHFDALFDRVSAGDYRGINITYPYKEVVLRKLKQKDSSVRLIGSCNTVLFEPEPSGANTDFTGFLLAYRETFGAANSGIVALAGCGGVGRAIGFSLVQLSAEALQLLNMDHEKARSLAESISANAPSLRVNVAQSIYEACADAHGLVNCTPIGMAGRSDRIARTRCRPRLGS